MLIIRSCFPTIPVMHKCIGSLFNWVLYFPNLYKPHAVLSPPCSFQFFWGPSLSMVGAVFITVCDPSGGWILMCLFPVSGHQELPGEHTCCCGTPHVQDQLAQSTHSFMCYCPLLYNEMSTKFCSHHWQPEFSVFVTWCMLQNICLTLQRCVAFV